MLSCLCDHTMARETTSPAQQLIRCGLPSTMQIRQLAQFLKASGLQRRRIEHAHKRFLRSEMPRLPWLDQLTLPQLDKLAQVCIHDTDSGWLGISDSVVLWGLELHLHVRQRQGIGACCSPAHVCN